MLKTVLFYILLIDVIEGIDIMHFIFLYIIGGYLGKYNILKFRSSIHLKKDTIVHENRLN